MRLRTLWCSFLSIIFHISLIGCVPLPLYVSRLPLYSKITHFFVMLLRYFPVFMRLPSMSSTIRITLFSLRQHFFQKNFYRLFSAWLTAFLGVVLHRHATNVSTTPKTGIFDCLSLCTQFGWSPVSIGISADRSFS